MNAKRRARRIAIAGLILIILAELSLVNYLFFSARLWRPFINVANADKHMDLLLIFLGSGILTFLSTVLTGKEDERLKNSSFGALASGVVTLIISLIKKEDHEQTYLLYAFIGSALGAFNGWLVYAGVAFLTYLRYDFTIVPFIELIAHGLDSMSDKIIAIENGVTNNKLKTFLEKNSAQWNLHLNADLHDLKAMAESILASVTELLNLADGTLQFRMSIIKFEFDANRKYSDGFHWIFYYGSAAPFRKEKPFGPDSQAYLMVSNPESERIKFFNSKEKVANRQSNDRYKSFTLFKLSDHCILTIDWAFRESIESIENMVKPVEESLYATVVPVLNSITDRIIQTEAKLPPAP